MVFLERKYQLVVVQKHQFAVVQRKQLLTTTLKQHQFAVIQKQQHNPTATYPSNVSPYSRINAVAGTNACRLRLRLPNRMSTLCVFKLATVEELMNYLSNTNDELKGKRFDLLAGTPPCSLLDKVGKRIASEV